MNPDLICFRSGFHEFSLDQYTTTNVYLVGVRSPREGGASFDALFLPLFLERINLGGSGL